LTVLGYRLCIPVLFIYGILANAILKQNRRRGSMDRELHRELLKNIESLKNEVCNYDSSSLIGACTIYLRRKSFPNDEVLNLVSPAKQCFYLLGVMLTTLEPANPRNFDKRAVKKITTLLNDIYEAYGWMFWPSEEEVDNLTQEWYRCREVAMPAFLHYFNNPLLASVEQIKQRVIEDIQPFDDVLRENLGLSSLEVIKIVDSISNLLQTKLDEYYDLAKIERKLRLGLLECAEAEGWDKSRLEKEANSSGYNEFLTVLFNKMNMLFSFNQTDLVEETDMVNKFFSSFSIRRNGEVDFTYITEENPAENCPLFQSKVDSYSCPSLNALYTAAFKRMETILLKSSKKSTFLKARDKTLERSGAELFVQLIGDGAQCFYGLFETEDLHYEHDIIIIKERNLYVVEAKASPPDEPFRDPEKAYTRLKRHFKSDTGIQKGFEQANRILKRLRDEGSFCLYNKSTKVIELKFQDFDHIFCICLTRDDYGPLATNLNLLLEKSDDDVYPWVINIYVLESLVDAFKHLDLGEADLARYIEQRSQLHGKVFGTDELEYLGFFIRHGDLSVLIQQQANMIALNHNYSDIFDEIYEANKSGKKITVDVVEPILNDPRKDLLNEEGKLKKQKDDFIKYVAEKKRKRNNQLAKASRRKNRKKK
jgi:hypothetical protein